jgi:adenosylcobinamide-GDP ribazoletransferase
MPGRRRIENELFGRSIIFFPVIGLIIGLILVGLNWLLLIFLPPSLVDLLLVVSLAGLGGVFHLADFIKTGNSIFSGAGVVGVCLLLLVKFVALNNIPGNWIAETLVLTMVVSRWAVSYVVVTFPSAPSSARARAFKQEARWWRLLIATVIALLVAGILLQLTGLIIMLIIWAGVLVMAAYLKARFGGLTAESYGAINEVAEVCLLSLFCLLTHIRWLA